MSKLLADYLEHQVSRASNALDAFHSEPTKEHHVELAWRVHRLVRMAQSGAVFHLPPALAAVARAFMQ